MQVKTLTKHDKACIYMVYVCMHVCMCVCLCCISRREDNAAEAATLEAAEAATLEAA